MEFFGIFMIVFNTDHRTRNEIQLACHHVCSKIQKRTLPAGIQLLTWPVKQYKVYAHKTMSHNLLKHFV